MGLFGLSENAVPTMSLFVTALGVYKFISVNSFKTHDMRLTLLVSVWISCHCKNGDFVRSRYQQPH